MKILKIFNTTNFSLIETKKVRADLLVKNKTEIVTYG